MLLAIKSQRNKGRQPAANELPKRRGSNIWADVEEKLLAREDGESPHLPLPTQGASRKRKPLVPVMDSLSNLSMLDATDKLTGVHFIDGLTYSDHEPFDNVISAALHALAAKKILSNPQLIEEAQVTLERWISKQTPTPRPLLEWRRILARTPQKNRRRRDELNLRGDPTSKLLTPLFRFDTRRESRCLRSLW
jgi:hypothetical protein